VTILDDRFAGHQPKPVAIGFGGVVIVQQERFDVIRYSCPLVFDGDLHPIVLRLNAHGNFFIIFSGIARIDDQVLKYAFDVQIIDAGDHGHIGFLNIENFFS